MAKYMIWFDLIYLLTYVTDTSAVGEEITECKIIILVFLFWRMVYLNGIIVR